MATIWSGNDRKSDGRITAILMMPQVILGHQIVALGRRMGMRKRNGELLAGGEDRAVEVLCRRLFHGCDVFLCLCA